MPSYREIQFVPVFAFDELFPPRKFFECHIDSISAAFQFLCDRPDFLLLLSTQAIHIILCECAQATAAAKAPTMQAP